MVNVEAERTLMASIMLDPEKILPAIIEHRVSDAWFADRRAQQVFQAVMRMAIDPITINAQTVAIDIERHSPPDLVPDNNTTVSLRWTNELCQWIDAIPPGVSATKGGSKSLITTLWDAYTRRQVLRTCGGLSARVQDDAKSPETMLSESIMDLIDLSGAIKPEPRTPTDTYNAILQRWESARTVGFRGMPSRLPAINSMLGGYRPGKIYVIASRPGGGKSTFLGNETISWGLQGLPVAVWSGEMDEEEYRSRMLAERADLSAYRMDIGKATDEDLQVLDYHAKDHAKLPIYINDDSMTVEEFIMWSAYEVRTHGAKAICADYSQIFMSGVRYGSRNEEVSQWMNVIRSGFKRLGVPLLLASQLRRAEQGREAQEPQLSDLRESGSIEQNAYGVILLHHYTDEDTEQEVSQALIPKNRGGPTGRVPLEFQRTRQRFVVKV